MDDPNDIPRYQDNILDFSYLPKDHQHFDLDICHRIRDHVSNRMQTRANFEKIVSCYRTPDGFRSCSESLPLSLFGEHEICRLFLPLWALVAFVPINANLGIVEVTLAHFPGFSVLPSVLTYMSLLSYVEGSLEIGQLNILHGKAAIDECQLQEFLFQLGITCKHDDIKLIDVFSEVPNWQDLSCIQYTSQESPHIMFGSCRGIWNVFQPPPKYGSCFNGDHILIATLGYGYNKFPFLNETRTEIIVHEKIQAAKSTNTGDTKSAHDNLYDHWLTTPWIIHDYTKHSPFVICQTTDDNGIIVNGATAKALDQLIKKWESHWKNEFDNLVVLIPYGGQFMKDEMEKIYEATKKGIIFVCAAGREGGDVVFPAALGTVISVGVAKTGPKGREIDVSVDFSIRPAKLLNIFGNEVELPRDCGVAAARVTGLISLLLSRINSIIRSPEKYLKNPAFIKMARYIEQCLKYYLHTCMIRELLVNEGNGSHDPQMGYGEGEEIIMSLLCMEPSTLLQKLANVVVLDPVYTRTNDLNCKPVSEEDRKKVYRGLKGKSIEVGVIDEFPYSNDITLFCPCNEESTASHGEKCAEVLQNISPESKVWCVKSKQSNVSAMATLFNTCLSDNKSIKVISCSVSSPCFDYGLCTAVNKAVVGGKIIVFAAGNYGQSQRNSIDYPGRIGNIIVVGGRDKYYNRTEFSSVGREMDFLARAEFKTSRSVNGTSFAAPVVAGYIALLLQFINEEMKDDVIKIWSRENEDKPWLWNDVSLPEAAQNVYAMRTLLKLLVPKPKVHSEMEGFGCLDFSQLFPSYRALDEYDFTESDAKQFTTEQAKEKIRQTLAKFYKRDA